MQYGMAKMYLQGWYRDVSCVDKFIFYLYRFHVLPSALWVLYCLLTIDSVWIRFVMGEYCAGLVRASVNGFFVSSSFSEKRWCPPQSGPSAPSFSTLSRRTFFPPRVPFSGRLTRPSSRFSSPFSSATVVSRRFYWTEAVHRSSSITSIWRCGVPFAQKNRTAPTYA